MRSAAGRGTLIIMDSLLIMTPPVSDYLGQRQVTQLLSELESGNVTLQGQMTGIYRFGCWAAGILMIGVGVVGSFVRRNTDADKAKA